jgi:hypothetical protein
MTPRWGRRIAVALVVVAVAGVWSVVVAGKLLAARRDLLAGRSQADLAKSMTTSADLEQARPVPLLQQASVDFADAHHLLATPLLAAARYLPVIGRQLRSAETLAAAGDQTADAAAHAISGVHTALAGDTSGGPQRLAKIRAFLDLATTADRSLRAVKLGPTHGLVSTLADGRNRLADQLSKTDAGLTRGIAAGQAALDILSGQHKVLLLAVNNAEMRAGSGMILEMGLMQTDNGRLQVGRMLSFQNYPIPPGSVPVPPQMAAQWGWTHPTDDWQELLNSPSFDVTAPTAARMWEAAGQPAVDAVMAIDPVLLADIVGVTGPVTTNGITYSADRVVRQLLYEQYSEFSNDTSQIQRRLQLGDLAGAVFDRLDAGGWSETTLGQSLAEAAAKRHVLVWARAPADEAGWLSAGAGGALTDRSLMVNVANRGRNKLDYFLATAAQMATVTNGATTDVTVRLHMANNTPPGQSDEDLGIGAGGDLDLYPGQHLSPGDYLALVSVDLPAGAQNVTMDGVASPTVDSIAGPSFVIASQFIVPRGGTQDVAVHFTLPGGRGALRVEPSARYPAMTWRAGDQSWSDDSGHLVSW